MVVLVDFEFDFIFNFEYFWFSNDVLDVVFFIFVNIENFNVVYCVLVVGLIVVGWVEYCLVEKESVVFYF